MMPTQTHGICGECREPNPYTEINCVRCGARLAWAYLIDGKNDSDFDTPAEKFFAKLAEKVAPPSEQPVQCRSCNKAIAPDEKICPHCRQWLVSAETWSSRGDFPGRGDCPLVDSNAPEIQRLLELNRKKSTET